MKRCFLLFLSLVLLCLCFAHEYILLANKYRLQKGDNLEMHLMVADGFNIITERPFQKSMTKFFGFITERGVTDLTITDNGSLPVLNRKVDFDGGGIAHLERDYAKISLPTQKFLDYLDEDHIENIASKVDRKKSEQRERYTRYIKCLVQSGNNFDDTLYKMVTGQTFEIILMENPYRMKTGDVLKVKVYFMGNPLSGKTVTARNRTGSEPSITFTAKTNAQGICSFILSRKGEWFLHATYMIECPDKADSDWESFWSSYSFEVDK